MSEIHTIMQSDTVVRDRLTEPQLIAYAQSQSRTSQIDDIDDAIAVLSEHCDMYVINYSIYQRSDRYTNDAGIETIENFCYF